MALLSVKYIEIKISSETKLQTETGFEIKTGEIVLLSGKNGSGKSIIIKTIMDDLYDNDAISAKAEITFDGYVNLAGSDTNRQQFNQAVCYVSQKDAFEASNVIDCCLTSLATIPAIAEKVRYVFDFVKRFKLYAVCYSDVEECRITWKNYTARKLLKKCNIAYSEASQESIKTALFLAKNPNRLSGGQEKIANICASLIRYEYSQLCIIDEPLNALDYDNVRLFSNMLNAIHLEKPEMGMLIVTHCRAIPCINRVLTIEDGRIIESNEKFTCSSCFGDVDEDGFYN